MGVCGGLGGVELKFVVVVFQTWINLGNKQRSIAATGMNDKSSRSHSVFSVKLTQTQVTQRPLRKLH